jgi:hypothetical protein
MPVLKWSPDGGQTIIPLQGGIPGPEGPEGPQGPPGGLYVQDDEPDWETPPDGFALWLDSDEDPESGYVDKTGDEMTGPLTLPGGTSIRWPGADRMLYTDDAADALMVLNIAGGLAPLRVGSPTIAEDAATKGYVDSMPSYVYTEGKQAQPSGGGSGVPNFVTGTQIDIGPGRWIVQAQACLKQVITLDTSWVAIARAGVGVLPQTAGAAHALDVGEHAQHVSAVAMITVPAGETWSLWPVWWVNGGSGCDLIGAVNGPSSQISATRIGY